MSQQFEVDTDGLRSAHARFRDLSDSITQLSQDLQSRMSALGTVWGDDKAGKAFAQNYTPARDELLTGMAGMADVVDSTADGVETMSRGFLQTEQNNVDAGQRLNAHLGGGNGEGTFARHSVAMDPRGVHDPVGPWMREERPDVPHGPPAQQAGFPTGPADRVAVWAGEAPADGDVSTVPAVPLALIRTPHDSGA